jgi:hypothetical protein
VIWNTWSDSIFFQISLRQVSFTWLPCKIYFLWLSYALSRTWKSRRINKTRPVYGCL